MNCLVRKEEMSFNQINMYTASIFQKNITSSSIESKKAIGFDNCLVEISSQRLKITNNGTVLLNSELKSLEEDTFTISLLGNYTNGVQFRIIRPTNNSLQNLKKRFDCETAFSIASIDPSGYAVHFILTNSNQKTNVGKVIAKGKNDQIQRLIEGSIMALQADLESNFVDYTKRLLQIIPDTMELSKYNNSKKILDVMKNNRQMYTESENQQIL